MKKVTTALLGIAACFMVPSAYAADPAAPAGDTHHKFESRADTNHDGDVTKEEFHAQAQKRFDEADANHDGKLSQEERHAAWEKHREKVAAWKTKHGENTAEPAGGKAQTSH